MYFKKEIYLVTVIQGHSMQDERAGHRRRLLDRFTSTGLAGFHDYEIIELLLTFAIPRKDTKSIAKDLIARYKTVSAILNAPADSLEQFSGIGPIASRFLALFKEVMAYCLSEKYERQSAISRRRDVEEYLRFHFGMRKDEFVAVLFLDNSNRVLATEEIVEGTVNQCVVYPRVIMEKAIRHGAAAMIMAHNHPGGSVHASESDWKITERLHAAGKLLEITLLDHIIIAHDTVVSLRDQSRWPG
jgi:DNA repair protein RadC